jgi:hypothetical protein
MSGTSPSRDLIIEISSSILHTEQPKSSFNLKSSRGENGKVAVRKLEYRRIYSIRRASVDSMQLLTMDDGGISARYDSTWQESMGELEAN